MDCEPCDVMFDCFGTPFFAVLLKGAIETPACLLGQRGFQKKHARNWHASIAQMKNAVQHPCGNEVVTKWLRSAGMTILCMVVQKVTLRWECGETGFGILVGAPGFCRRVINSSPSLSAWARDDTVRNGSPSWSHQARAPSRRFKKCSWLCAWVWRGCCTDSSCIGKSWSNSECSHSCHLGSRRSNQSADGST